MGGFLLILVGMILPLAAGVLALPIKLLCTMILMVTEFAASLPFSYLRVISPSIVTIIVFYLVLLILSRERPGFVKKPLLACFMLVAVLLAGQLLFGLLEPRELKMVFLDVGQGDCCFIQTPDGKNILIDGGGKEGQNIGEDVVIPFLLKNGIWSLDLVIMSHCHDDHIGGLIPVLDQIKSEAFMEFPPGQENEAYLTLKEVITKKNIDVISVNRGQSFLIGDEVWLHILYPDEKNVKHLSNGNENNYSLVILLEYRDTSVLFTGDIEREAEYYLIGRISQTADILKIPHHGSNTSSTQAFLDKVSPETGIIQVGTNFFGHPSAQTLDRLDERGIKVFRNDNHGAVLLNYRNNKWTVRTMLEETNE